MLLLLLLQATAGCRRSRIVAVIIVANASDVIIVIVLSRSHHILGLCIAVRPRTWFRCIREGQTGGINYSIVAHQRNGHLRGLTYLQGPLKVKFIVRIKRIYIGKPTQSHSPRNCEISGTTHSNVSVQRYMVSASTSPNHTCRCGVKLSPLSSSMATSPPPLRLRELTIGTGVTGELEENTQ